MWVNDDVVNKSSVNTEGKDNYFDDDDQYLPKLD
jgi:hypothetical protein